MPFSKNSALIQRTDFSDGDSTEYAAAAAIRGEIMELTIWELLQPFATL
jgi:hypothetical protein